jgi:hypothetical protein
MSLLKALKTQDNIKDEVDSLGGGGPVDANAYLSTITMAYIDKSAGGAMSLNLNLKLDNGKEFRQSLWMTSGDAKGNKNYYERDGEKNYLPGFILANSLCLLTVGKEIGDMEPESKTIKLWNSEAKAETLQQKDVLTELLNKEVITGLVKNLVDRTQKGDDGEYHPTGETREENEVDKFFRAKDSMTTAEIRAGAEKPEFLTRWVEKNAGQVRDRTKKDKGTGAGFAAAGAAKSASTKPNKSLFQ